MGEVTPFHCLFEIYSENTQSERIIFMTSSNSFTFYYEVFSWLKIQHSVAKVPCTLPRVCSVWVFNKYYLMIRQFRHGSLWMLMIHIPLWRSQMHLGFNFIKVKVPLGTLESNACTSCTVQTHGFTSNSYLLLVHLLKTPVEACGFFGFHDCRWFPAPTQPFCK